jgi:hypothetical protein
VVNASAGSRVIDREVNMGRVFEIYWPDFEVVVDAELFDDENPEMCDKFWDHLPFETIMAASMSAGEMFKIPVPFSLPMPTPDKMVLFPDQPPGTIVGGAMGSLLLRYGIVVEPFQLPRLALIPEAHLHRLKDISYKLRDAYFFSKETNFATFRRKG